MNTARTPAFGFLSVLLLASALHAQHLRIFACAIGNDSAGAFMGGSSNGSGLYQSDDTGKTWRHLGWNNIKCFSMDMVQSSNGRILYEATGLGVLRSTDYGEHWKQLTDWRISEVMDLAINQKNPDEIYIATAHGPWRTRDGGRVWGKVIGRSTLSIEDTTFYGPFPGFVDRIDYLDGSNEQPLLNPVGAFGSRSVVVRGPQGQEVIHSSLTDGVLVNDEAMLPQRQIWAVKYVLVTP